MKGCVVNVATGDHYIKGQKRLLDALGDQAAAITWTNEMPPGSPAHHEIPYAFKAYALQYAAVSGQSLLLWADASILPVAPLGPLFDRIAEEGYWISNNGWNNAEWTADFAYRDLGVTPEENALIPHVASTAFGINTLHPTGWKILTEFARLARTRAFCGPWRNTPTTPCGGAGVLGHRHDQSALSLIAWRMKCRLTQPPDVFAYLGGETKDTVLLAHGAY